MVPEGFPSYVGPEFTLRDLLEVLLESSWALVPRQLPGGSGRVLGGPGRVFRAMLVLSSLLEISRSPSWSLPAPRGPSPAAPRGPSPASLRPFRIHREAILACLSVAAGSTCLSACVSDDSSFQRIWFSRIRRLRFWPPWPRERRSTNGSLVCLRAFCGHCW